MRINCTLFWGFAFFLFLVVLFLSASDSREGNVVSGLGDEKVFRLKPFENVFRAKFDPADDSSPTFTLEQVFNGLVQLNKDLNVAPDLAEYWDISPDRKKIRFYLRKGVLFHHGDELSAEDVKFSLERIIDPKTNSPYFRFFLTRVVGAAEFRAGRAENVSGLKVLGRYIFEIHWTKPFSSALVLLSMPFCKILPKSQVLEKGRVFFESPSGTGPFVFDHWIRDTRLNRAGVRFKRFDRYYKGSPRLEIIEFCPYYTLRQFLDGEIDSIPVLSERLLESEFQIFLDGMLYPVFLGLSCHIPPLDNLEVRKALAYGVDKSEIIRATYEAQYSRKLLNSYIPSRIPGFFLIDDKTTCDVEQARSILGKAGFPDKRPLPELTLLMRLPRSDFKNRMYNELERQFAALGIRLRRDYFDSPSKVRRYTRPYLLLQGRIMDFPDPEDVIRPLFSSDSQTNLFGYKNTGLDRLLQEAEEEPSWSARIKLFRKAEKILYAEIPAIPLFSQQNRIVMHSHIHGVETPAMGLHHLNTASIWLDESR